jgi:DNA (cytosine-5)-methyltransferase 1
VTSTPPLVLSLFPGIGLLDMAFELEGFCVVRGPDLLWGGDVHRFHPPKGRFDGVIGGPPCQIHSSASEIAGTGKVDLIPEFLRVVDEAAPAFTVMENVLGAIGHDAIPRNWHPVILRDWDCGGETARRRVFYTWPFWSMEPGRAPGSPAKSVMATTWKHGKSGSQYVADKGFLPGDLPIAEYGRLQGCEELARHLATHDSRPSRSFIVHVLGNGVPLPMGRTIARAVRIAMYPHLVTTDENRRTLDTRDAAIVAERGTQEPE